MDNQFTGPVAAPERRSPAYDLRMGKTGRTPCLAAGSVISPASTRWRSQASTGSVMPDTLIFDPDHGCWTTDRNSDAEVQAVFLSPVIPHP